MEIRKTTLRQWWDASASEQSTIKRGLFKGLVVVAGVLGALYHAYDWIRCREQNKNLQEYHPKIGDESDGLHIRSTLTAEVQAPAPAPSLEQRVAAFRDLGEPQRVAYDHLLDLTRGGLDSATERQLLQVGQKPDVVDAAVELVLGTLDAEHREKLRAAKDVLNKAIFEMLSSEGWEHRHSDVKSTLTSWANVMKVDPHRELDLSALADELAPGWKLAAGAASPDKRFAQFLQRHHQQMKESIERFNEARAELEDGHAACRTLVTTRAAAMTRYQEAEDLRRAESAIEAYGASLTSVLQHLSAADAVLDEMEATTLKNLAHRKDDLRMDAELEDFFARSDALLAQTKALREVVQPLTDQKKDA